MILNMFKKKKCYSDIDLFFVIEDTISKCSLKLKRDDQIQILEQYLKHFFLALNQNEDLVIQYLMLGRSIMLSIHRNLLTIKALCKLVFPLM